jgi:hypothetical protein
VFVRGVSTVTIVTIAAFSTGANYVIYSLRSGEMAAVAPFLLRRHCLGHRE